MSEKEKRIRAITRIYYSNPKVKEAIFNFAKEREVVPRYFEGFGKRPDALQYLSDVTGLVNKGATSFHASEEIWNNPLEINSDMHREEMDSIRKAWDLLIDIDSPFLDYSKIATNLIIKELEKHGIKNYGLKFSGSKGFHIIVPSKSFPKFFQDIETKEMFPEWPRAISEYIMFKIRPEYNKYITSLNINFEAVKERTNLSKSDLTKIPCPNCGAEAKKTTKTTLQCDRCNNIQIRPNYKKTKRRLRCIEESCPGEYELKESKDSFKCESCNYSDFNKTDFSSRNIIRYTMEAIKSNRFSEDFKEEVSAEEMASLDLVLVAPRHLFRMPYSLHEKTALASIVLSKEQITSFSPKDANPLKIKVKDFYPKATPEEAKYLLQEAVSWKKLKDEKEEKEIEKKYSKYSTPTHFKEINFKDVPESIFPKPIKKLLKGLKEGKKRGFFVLLTFLRSLNFPPDYINKKIREWNKLNSPPLKEGYIKSQIDWHLKQKRKILPPNYSNNSFYKDINLFSENSKPKAKNPISEVLKKLKN
jgi:DNA primase catalytic subunit